MVDGVARVIVVHEELGDFETEAEVAVAILALTSVKIPGKRMVSEG